jgi:hypothetical protein
LIPIGVRLDHPEGLPAGESFCIVDGIHTIDRRDRACNEIIASDLGNQVIS